MNNTKYQYDFDPYGTNPENKIVSEPHTITAVNGTDFNFVVPRFAPFFRRDIVVRNSSTGARLRPNVDYYFGFRFDQILVSGSMQPVYGAIVFNDRTLSGNIEIDYQTLGGEFVLSESQVLEILANKQIDPRTVTWGSIVDLPTEFPPIPHRVNAEDMVGMSEVVASNYNIADAIREGNVKAMEALMEHIQDHNNPHHITLADLGIDQLGNLVPASKEQAEGGTDNTYYMTALRTKQFTNANVIPVIDAHKADDSNPHNVTAAQVGLGLVNNWRAANQNEAAAGVADNLYMVPSTTTTLVQTLVPVLMRSHTDRQDNPHNVTATQVGLGNVPNFPMATEEQAIGGVNRNTFMSPYLVNLALKNGSEQPLIEHNNNHNNPHEVTAAQVGLDLVNNYAMANASDANAMTRSDLYLSPQNLGSWWSAVARVYIDQQIANGLNMTKDDVGLGLVVNAGFATDAEAIDPSKTQVYMDPKGTNLAILNKDLVKAYSIQPAYMDTLAKGFPATMFVATMPNLSSGLNNTWTSTLRTIKSPFNRDSAVSVILSPSPATYYQRAFVDASSTGIQPGFIFGYQGTDTDPVKYAAIFFKNKACYLGTYENQNWTYGPDVALASLTGTSVQVTCTVSGKNIAVTVGTTTVNVDISALVFNATNYTWRAGYVNVGSAPTEFTPVSMPAFTGKIVDVIDYLDYTFSNNTWTVVATNDSQTISNDLTAGRRCYNYATGECFAVTAPEEYFAITQPVSV
ncbi:putative virion structural protein [Serratia phage vB_SmaM_Haymo]|nr:putative virion structural protein [Serratia phage vB_SmaM_Haymo]